MAKDKAKDKPDTKGKKNKSADNEDAAEKAAEREFKFGVEDIAEELDIKPASVRVQLRNKGIEKAGKSYGWNSKSELKEVVEQLKASAKDDDDDKPAKKSKKAKADDDDQDEKPAKKSKAKKDADDEKPAKKAKSKKSKKDVDEDDDD